jgi:hypothetical protein
MFECLEFVTDLAESGDHVGFGHGDLRLVAPIDVRPKAVSPEQ